MKYGIVLISSDVRFIRKFDRTMMADSEYSLIDVSGLENATVFPDTCDLVDLFNKAEHFTVELENLVPVYASVERVVTLMTLEKYQKEKPNHDRTLRKL